ncbi:MAG: hypothetical protein L6Q31_11730 [Fimbriimonadaceae bacterium]|nr:hypothetical protein [Fimbriimonadaceae bacterium]NUM37956.1 hypothetical protein [Armatimonadota bacterium]
MASGTQAILVIVSGKPDEEHRHILPGTYEVNVGDEFPVSFGPGFTKTCRIDQIVNVGAGFLPFAVAFVKD